LNVIDSSGWIEYLAGGPNAEFFAGPIEGDEPLIVPSLSLFEVFRHVLRHAGREDALRVAAAMRRGTIVDLEASLALAAAELSVEAGLATADSAILATARSYGATLWTQDADFEGMDEVRFRARR
jgi:toxin FitB